VGPKPYLLPQERRTEERVQIDFRKARCEPFLVARLERFALVLLVASAKMIPVGAGEGGVLARLPEPSDLEIAGQMLGVRTVHILKERRKDLGCAVEFTASRSGINEIEGRQPTQENLVPIQVAGEPRDPMMGWVAVDKSGQRRYWRVSISGGNEEGKSVLEKAVQAWIQVLRPVGLPREKAGWYAQLFVEKLEFFLLGFEVLKIGMGQDEVENQQPCPNEVGGVEPMIPKVVLPDQIVNLA